MTYGNRRVVVRAHGHPHIRATHAKTLELTRESTVTPRATCVIGVAADLDADTLGLLRGPVRITIAAAGSEAYGEAVINPAHRVRDRLVLRRSRFSDDDTLAVAATLTAEDLDPALVAALADPDTALTVEIEEIAPPVPLVLVRRADRPLPAGRLELLWRHADATVDLGAVRGAESAAGLTGTVAATVPGPAEALPPAAIGWLTAAAEGRARLAFLEPDGPAGALLSAGLPPAPALHLGRVTRQSVRRFDAENLLRPSPAPTVLTLPVEDAAPVLDRVASAAPDRRIAVPDGLLDVGMRMARVPAGEAATAVARLPVPEATVVLDAEPGGDRVDLAAVVRALAAAGVTPRTMSEALRPLGVTRRRLYGIVGDGPREH